MDLFSTVRILTFHYNQADFIELQYRTLKKFLSDDFELIVFNDAATLENKEWIEEVCDDLGIKCIRFEPEWHLIDPLNLYLIERLKEPSTINLWDWTSFDSVEEVAAHPSIRHCHVIQYALDHFGYGHDDLVVLMDGDNFLIKPISFRDLLGSNDLLGCSRQCDHHGFYRKQGLEAPPPSKDRLWLPWVVFIAFNPSKLPSPRELKFHVDVIQNHPNYPDHLLGDSGSAACRYIQKYPNLKIREFYWQKSQIFLELSCQELEKMGIDYHLIKLIEDIYPQHVQLFAFEHFIHFGSVSFTVPGHHKKAILFNKFINDILD
jgi:hypothetical protein